MKNEVSALMDGELDQREAEQVIATLKENESLREDWAVYHLIGDTIRQDSSLSSQSMQGESTTEPIPLNPTASQHHNRKTAVYAIAASVTAAVITTWFTLQSVDQTDPNTNTMMASQKSLTQPLPAVQSITAPGMNAAPPLLARPLAPAEINDYLFVHKEFLPGAVTHHPSNYVRPVINSSERYGR